MIPSVREGKGKEAKWKKSKRERFWEGRARSTDDGTWDGPRNETAPTRRRGGFKNRTAGQIQIGPLETPQISRVSKRILLEQQKGLFDSLAVSFPTLIELSLSEMCPLLPACPPRPLSAPFPLAFSALDNWASLYLLPVQIL